MSRGAMVIHADAPVFFRWSSVFLLVVLGSSFSGVSLAKRSKLTSKHLMKKKKNKSALSDLVGKPKNAKEAKVLAHLARKIDRVLRRRNIRRAKLGVVVMNRKGRVLYAKNAKKKFIPASNLKLLTLATALKYLGYYYKFKTKVYADAPIDAKGVLHGNLYIEGSGDPSFRSEELWRVSRDLYMKGLRKITGRVCFDATAFDRKRFGPGWEDHSNQPREKYRPYLAPIGALVLNFSTVTISVRPGFVVGNPARIMLDPNSYYFRKIINKTRTIQAGGRFKVRFKILPHRGYRDMVEVSGTVPINRKAKLFWRRINFPGWYAAFQFARFLRKQNIRVSYWPKRRTVPSQARVVHTHTSKPLGQIVQAVGKQSSNFTAEQVLKKMGQLRYSKPGSWKKGIRVVHKYIRGFGIAPKSYVMINGSGLGRANRLSPFQLATVLRNMLFDYRSRYEYLSALATSGRDGTLRRRMGNRMARGKIRGKTGSLDGVSTISGYVLTRDKKILIFSICMNGKLKQGRYFRRAQNQIGRILARFSE